MSAAPLLEVEDLRVHFETEDGLVRAVDGVSFSIAPGRTLGIVGESGCGKSVANLTILGLTRAPNARISGRISFEGRNLVELDEEGAKVVVHGDNGVSVAGVTHARGSHFRWQRGEKMYVGRTTGREPECTLTLSRRS